MVLKCHARGLVVIVEALAAERVEVEARLPSRAQSRANGKHADPHGSQAHRVEVTARHVVVVMDG